MVVCCRLRRDTNWVSAWMQDGGLRVVIDKPSTNAPTVLGIMMAHIDLLYSGSGYLCLSVDG